MVGFFIKVHMAEPITNTKENRTFYEVKQHYDVGFQETDRRATGKNRIGAISFNEADELFRSWIDENTWPYDALLFDPRIFTFLFEKTSRLISNKPQGKLIPREGSDMLGAKINNELLSYQWDAATQGGTMLSKWALMDLNARKYGASFSLCRWRYECDDKGKVLFDGPEMQVLNNRDIAHDLPATSIESCNWFQVRQYVTLQELEHVNDSSRTKPTYKNLDKLRYAIGRDAESKSGGGDGRSVNWASRSRAIQGLEQDPVGKDDTFKTLELVTEYRKNKWITFSPKHGVVVREIDNPYQNNEIPIDMLRYYQVDDDLYGMSEIEPIKGLQKALNAILCQYVDEINQKLYSPIAVGPGVRQHTLQWGKGARWIMNNPLTDFRLVESKSNAAQYFNNTYSVLVAAMMNSLGESSLGVSNVQPYQKDKTATEIKALQLQRNARDNFNQIFLGEAIKRQYMLWYSMNQILLFSDPKSLWHSIRISGTDAIKYFMQNELSADELSHEQSSLGLEEITGGDGSQNIDMNTVMTPKHPVSVNGQYKHKFESDEQNKSGVLYVEPADLKGNYDFAIDVESMQVNSDEERKQARQAAVSLLATNPNVTTMLLQEGTKPKFKELFVTWLEDLGFSDAERFFEKAPAAQPQQPGAEAGQMGDIIKQMMGGGGGAPGGIPGGAEPNAGGEAPNASPFGALGPSSPKAYEESNGAGVPANG